MNTSYSFSSDFEPTDEQLAWLMERVLEDVKERAAKAEEKYRLFHIEQMKQMRQEWQLKYPENDTK